MSLSLGAIMSGASGVLGILKNPKVLIGVVIGGAFLALGWYALDKAEQSGELAQKLDRWQQRAEQQSQEAQRLRAEIERREELAREHRERLDEIQTRNQKIRTQIQQAADQATGDYSRCRRVAVPDGVIDGLRDSAANTDGENGAP
jgi:septal ring factor EnvC (AmiA/AmiB activator)